MRRDVGRSSSIYYKIYGSKPGPRLIASRSKRASILVLEAPVRPTILRKKRGASTAAAIVIDQSKSKEITASVFCPPLQEPALRSLRCGSVGRSIGAVRALFLSALCSVLAVEGTLILDERRHASKRMLCVSQSSSLSLSTLKRDRERTRNQAKRPLAKGQLSRVGRSVGRSVAVKFTSPNRAASPLRFSPCRRRSRPYRPRPGPSPPTPGLSESRSTRSVEGAEGRPVSDGAARRHTASDGARGRSVRQSVPTPSSMLCNATLLDPVHNANTYIQYIVLSYF